MQSIFQNAECTKRWKICSQDLERMFTYLISLRILCCNFPYGGDFPDALCNSCYYFFFEITKLVMIEIRYKKCQLENGKYLQKYRCHTSYWILSFPSDAPFLWDSFPPPPPFLDYLSHFLAVVKVKEKGRRKEEYGGRKGEERQVLSFVLKFSSSTISKSVSH